MTNLIKGKKIVIGITVSAYAIRGESGIASYKLLQGIFRFILTALILFFFYKGYQWAKWLMTILLFLGGLLTLLTLVQGLEIFTLLLTIIYLSIGFTMIFSNSVRDFLNFQKDKRVTAEGLEQNQSVINESTHQFEKK